MHDVVLVEIIHSLKDGADDCNRVFFGEFTPREDALEKFPSCGQFEGEIILGSRLKPFIELDLCVVNRETGEVAMRIRTMFG